MKPYSGFKGNKAAIAFAMGLISLPMIATSGGCTAQAEQFERFADWCENRADLTPAARHTVEVLLDRVRTQDCQIADEYLSGTFRLGFSHVQISDVTPFSSLTNLKILYLNHNQISDISSLSSLSNLITLHLSNNQISDVSSLSSLSNMGRLYLNHNQISDVSSLSSLSNLTILSLSHNQISDVSPLSSLSNMEKLHLMHNQISDVNPLSSLSNLNLLVLIGNSRLIDRNCPVELQRVCRF